MDEFEAHYAEMRKQINRDFRKKMIILWSGQLAVIAILWTGIHFLTTGCS